MSWIVNSVGKSLEKFPKDELLLKTLSILDRELADRITEYPEATAFTLLDIVTGRKEAEDEIKNHLAEILAQRGIQVSDLNDHWRTLREVAAHRFDKDYRALLFTLDEIDAMATSNPAEAPKAKFQWPLLDRTGSAQGAGAGIRFKLSGNAAAHIEMEALRKSAERPTAQTRLGFHGKLTAGADLPFDKGLFESAASGELKLDYHFYARGSTIMANALAASLAGLESPFDLSGLQEQLAERDQDGLLTQARLHSVQIEAKRALSLGGKFALTTPFSLAAGAVGTFSGNIGYSVKRNGNFAYRVSAAPASRDLIIELERAAISGDTFEANLGIGIDLTEAFAGIQQRLVEHMGNAGDFLKEIEGLLLSGEAVREKLGAGVEGAINGLPQADLIRALIGFDAENSASGLLTRKLVDSAERHVDKWKDKGDQLTATAAEIIDTTLGGLPLQPSLIEQLQQALLEPVQVLLVDIEAELQDRLKNLVEGEGYGRLVTALDKLGGHANHLIEDVEERVDAIVMPVREQLGRFQAKLAQVAAIVEKAAEFKVKAALSYERSVSSKRALALKVLMRPDQDPERAQSYLNQLLLGQMNAVFEQLRTAPSGGVIEGLEGSLMATANLDEKRGIDVMVMDFQLANSSMLDVDVAYEIDLNGDVRVTSRAEIANRVRTLKESRRANFLNVFKLAGAASSGSVSISSSLSYKDQKLEADELHSYLSSFESAGNIANGETTKALAAYKALLAQRPGEDIGGELSIATNLRKPHIDQLLQINAVGGFDDGKVFDVAIPLVAAASEHEGYFEFRIDGALKRWLKAVSEESGLGVPADVAGAIKVMTPETAAALSASHHGDIESDDYGVDEFDHRQYVTALALRHQRIQYLCNAFRLMREVYQSGTAQPVWTQQQYVEAQESIDEWLSAWVRPGKEHIPFIALVTDDVRPMLVAFYSIVRRLAGSGPMAVSMSLSEGEMITL